MPLYDYECERNDCLTIFEVYDKIEKTDIRCPICGSGSKRLISAPNINMGVGAYGYYDKTLRKYLHTNKQRRDECNRQGVYPQGDTPKNGDTWV